MGLMPVNSRSEAPRSGCCVYWKSPIMPESPTSPILPPFDAHEFWRLYGDGLSSSQSEWLHAHLETRGTEQRHLVEQIPSVIVPALLRDVGVKALLGLLNLPTFAELKRTAFRGFQPIASLVRHPTVQKRLGQHFQAHRGELQTVLLLWGTSTPVPPVIERVLQTSTPTDTTHALQLIREFGVEATLLALAFRGEGKAFEYALQLYKEPLSLTEALENLPEPESEAAKNPDDSPEAQNQDDREPNIDWKARAERVEREAATAQRTVDTLQKKLADANALKSQVKVLESEFVKTQAAHRQHIEQLEKKLSHATQKLQGELDELKRQDERQSRRLKATEREKEELEVENKRLKKQLRHTQQLLEEERKKLAQYEKRPTLATEPPKLKPDTPPAEAKTAKPLRSKPLTPFDEIFEWQADGRKVRVTPREVRRLIDTNDEESVFAMMLALESLAASPRPVDTELRYRFLHRMREMAPFYARVLTHPTTRVLVDASNVARSQLTRYGKGQLSLLLQMREELRRLDYWPIVFVADASLRHHIDQGKAFMEMVERGEIVQSDKGVEADEVLAREARRSGATVVTNDARFFHKVSPDFAPPRLAFRVTDGAVFVEEL